MKSIYLIMHPFWELSLPRKHGSGPMTKELSIEKLWALPGLRLAPQKIDHQQYRIIIMRTTIIMRLDMDLVMVVPHP